MPPIMATSLHSDTCVCSAMVPKNQGCNPATLPFLPCYWGCHPGMPCSSSLCQQTFTTSPPWCPLIKELDAGMHSNKCSCSSFIDPPSFNHSLQPGMPCPAPQCFTGGSSHLQTTSPCINSVLCLCVCGVFQYSTCEAPWCVLQWHSTCTPWCVLVH
jgi:hypothetical protein